MSFSSGYDVSREGYIYIKSDRVMNICAYRYVLFLVDVLW